MGEIEKEYIKNKRNSRHGGIIVASQRLDNMNHKNTCTHTIGMAGVFITLVFASGCATTSASLHEKQVELVAAGASPELAGKISTRKALELDEIIQLTASDLNPDIIVEAIHQSRAIYRIDSQDLAKLRAAGVNESIVDAVLASPHRNIDDQRAYWPHTFRNHGHFHRGHPHCGHRRRGRYRHGYPYRY